MSGDPASPAEIRLSNTVKSPENMRSTPPFAVLTEESAAEKRRKLLEALEKCDEDLRALKKIIDVVKSSVGTIADEENNTNNDNNKNNDEKFGGRDNKCLELNGDLQPSPVSVLEDFMTPASLLSGYSRRYTNGKLSPISFIFV